MAFYSKKVKSFAEAPVGAKVGIPNDLAMGGRALLILAANGIIKLRDGVGLLPSPYDVIENPKKLKFVEAYHQPAVRDFINNKYKGSVIAAF